jgi:pimeloyl-ACP methyl ester carboxylesterase
VADVQVKFARVNGLNTRYYVAGDGPTVVLVHGVGMTADIWIRNIDALSSDHRVIAPDLLGCGFSEGVTDPTTPPVYAMVEHLLSLFDLLEIDDCSIVGSSLGGWLTILAQAQRPQIVRALVLVACESVLHGDLGELRSIFEASYRNGLSAFSDATLEGGRRRIARLVFDLASVPEVVHLLQLTSQSLPDARTAFESRLAGLRRISAEDCSALADGIAAVSVPVLLVSGAQDVRGDPATAARLSEELNCEHVMFHECGHLPQLEHWEEFNRIVAEFLSQQSTRLP